MEWNGKWNGMEDENWYGIWNSLGMEWKISIMEWKKSSILPYIFHTY